MARKVFFSFDFDDVMAVNVVRNSNVVRAEDAQLPFADHSIYTAAKNTPGAIKRAIDRAISGTTVTVVLNGPTTWSSSWVRYEIAKSMEKGNGFIVLDMIGVGPRPVTTVGPSPLVFMGGINNGKTPAKITVYEYVGQAWVAFGALPTISNSDARYPSSLIAGNWKVADRFTRHLGWKSVSSNFSSTIEQVARDAGWPPAIEWI